MFKCVTRWGGYKKGNKQSNRKMIPMHLGHDLNHLTNTIKYVHSQFAQKCNRFTHLNYLSVVHRYKHRYPTKADINQHVTFSPVRALFRDPWQSQYFLWGFPFDAPQTCWLISWLNKCVMLRWATHLLQASTSYVNACVEYDGGFTLNTSLLRHCKVYHAVQGWHWVLFHSRELCHYNLYQRNTKKSLVNM